MLGHDGEVVPRVELLESFAGVVADPDIPVVERESPLGVDHAHVVGGKGGKAQGEVVVFLHPAGEQRQPLHGHPDLRIELGRDGIPVRAAERGVYAAGHGEVGVHALAPQPLDDLLAEAAQADRLEGELRVGGDDAEDVADGRVGIEAQQQVRAGQVEEVHAVALDNLPHVHQLAQQHGRARRSGTR